MEGGKSEDFPFTHTSNRIYTQNPLDSPVQWSQCWVSLRFWGFSRYRCLGAVSLCAGTKFFDVALDATYDSLLMMEETEFSAINSHS